jgi:hypothetical protein
LMVIKGGMERKKEIYFFPSFAGFWYPANNICISLVLVFFTASLPPPPNWVWFDLLIG